MISVPDAALLPSVVAPDAPLELVHDLGRKSVGIEGKGLVEKDARHLPVSGGRVLARATRACTCRTAGRLCDGGNARRGDDVAQTEAAAGSAGSSARIRAMLPRVSTARIAVVRCVGHFSDTYAVENDPDDPSERHGPYFNASEIRSVSIVTNCSGSNPFMRVARPPRLSITIVVGIDVIRSARARPSS